MCGVRSCIPSPAFVLYGLLRSPVYKVLSLGTKNYWGQLLDNTLSSINWWLWEWRHGSLYASAAIVSQNNNMIDAELCNTVGQRGASEIEAPLGSNH